MFKPYQGYLMGLPVTDNHLVFRWGNPDCKVLFSVCRKGGAADCHFASDKKGLRHIKQAIREWCAWVFMAFEWCKMVLAHIARDSIGRILVKCGFECIATSQRGAVYMRTRQ